MPKWKNSSIRKLVNKHSDSIKFAPITTDVAGNLILPNTSGDHEKGIKRAAPINGVDLVNKDYVDIILNGPYSLKIHSMGLVDDNNKVNFYEGKVRVVDTEGKECYFGTSCKRHKRYCQENEEDIRHFP